MFVSKFLSIRVKSWLRRNKTQRSTTAYTSAKRIGVIFCIDKSDITTPIEDFVHKLQNDNKEVDILAYFPHKREDYNHRYDCFTPQNISFWGNFNASEITKFIDQPFDYLYHIDKKPSTIIDGILAQSKAKCRIGVYEQDHAGYYELMVNANGNDHIQEMYNYTSILN